MGRAGATMDDEIRAGLSEALRVLWDHGPGTVRQIMGLPAELGGPKERSGIWSLFGKSGPTPPAIPVRPGPRPRSPTGADSTPGPIVPPSAPKTKASRSGGMVAPGTIEDLTPGSPVSRVGGSKGRGRARKDCPAYLDPGQIAECPSTASGPIAECPSTASPIRLRVFTRLTSDEYRLTSDDGTYRLARFIV
jgi:hypothetical protein